MSRLFGHHHVGSEFADSPFSSYSNGLQELEREDGLE